MLWNQEWVNNLVKTKKPIFLVDAMLGKLAKKLRLLGYDTIYSSNKDDDELIQIAKTEKFPGVTGPITFDQYGDRINPEIGFYELIPGKTVFLGFDCDLLCDLTIEHVDGGNNS